MKSLKTLAIIAAIAVANVANAQEKSNNGINPLSLRPVHESNVMFKTTLWRRLDLKEKENQPLFARGAEITKHLIDGVKAGVIEAYDNDSLSTKLTLEEFNKRLFKKFEGGGLSQEEIDAGFGGDTSGDDDGWGGGGAAEKKAEPKTSGTPAKPVDQSATGGYEMFPSELGIIEIKEDWIFDKQRSRQYADIQSITVMIPAENSPEGLEKPLASFKYKELERFFRTNPNCIWYNVANTAQHKNLADAFELRLFHGKIIRKSNISNKYLDQIYKSPKEGLLKSQQLEYELMEFEHNLWEY
jgi:hypothetical protein